MEGRKEEEGRKERGRESKEKGKKGRNGRWKEGRNVRKMNVWLLGKAQQIDSTRSQHSADASLVHFFT